MTASPTPVAGTDPGGRGPGARRTAGPASSRPSVDGAFCATIDPMRRGHRRMLAARESRGPAAGRQPVYDAPRAAATYWWSWAA
jgi:hypothetical protein